MAGWLHAFDDNVMRQEYCTSVWPKDGGTGCYPTTIRKAGRSWSSKMGMSEELRVIAQRYIMQNLAL